MRLLRIVNTFEDLKNIAAQNMTLNVQSLTKLALAVAGYVLRERVKLTGTLIIIVKGIKNENKKSSRIKESIIAKTKP